MNTLYWQLLWQQKKMAMLGVFLATITAYSGIALLAVSGWFISAAALAGLTAASAISFNFFTPGAMVRGLSISRTLGRYGERLASHEATFRIISRLRSALFRRLAHQPWQEVQLDRHQSGSRLLQDIDHIESIYLTALLPMVVNVAVVLGYLLALYLIWPALMFSALPWLFLAVMLMPWLYSRLVLDTQDILHQQRVQQWQVSSTLFSNLRTLILHDRLQSGAEQLFNQASATDLQESRSVNRQQGVILFTQFSLIGLILTVFWQAFHGWQQEQLQAAEVFMLLLLTLGSGDVLISTSPALAGLRLGLRALQRLDITPQSTDKILFQDKSEVINQDQNAGPSVNSNSVHLTNLNYRYPNSNIPVFEQFSYQFSGPGWYWICGPSGSGKSTLIMLLTGQLSAQQGKIVLPWQAKKNSSALLPENMGLMPQRIDILRASVRDNLNLHHGHNDETLWQALQLVELKHWAEQLPQQLDTWLGDGEWQASGGEMKRLGLARLILQDPSLILLDEPSAGLDSALAQRIFHRLSEHWQNKLVIANTHDRHLIQPGQSVVELARSDTVSL